MVRWLLVFVNKDFKYTLSSLSTNIRGYFSENSVIQAAPTETLTTINRFSSFADSVHSVEVLPTNDLYDIFIESSIEKPFVSD